MFKFADVYKSFLTFERSLPENDRIFDFFFKSRCKFRMESGLGFPDPVKFVHMVLPVVYLVFQACIGIFFDLFRKTLSYGLPVEI